METEAETGLRNYKPRNANAGWQLPEAGSGAWSKSSLRASWKNTPFQPPEVWEGKSLLFYTTKFTVICYGGPGPQPQSDPEWNGRRGLIGCHPFLLFWKWSRSIILKYNTVTNTNPSGCFFYLGVVRTTFVWEISHISNSMPNVNGGNSLTYGSFVIVIKFMTFIKLEIVLDYRHSIRFTSGFLGNRFWDSKTCVQEVYWAVPSVMTSVWGDGSRDGQREKLVCDVVVTEASAWVGWSFGVVPNRGKRPSPRTSPWMPVVTKQVV